MARYLLDSSALVKRYHQERGSADVERLFNEPGNRFFISRLALVEVHSSFARLVREGVLTESDFAKLISRLKEDVASTVLSVLAVSGPRLEDASSILGGQGPTNTVRTLDAIHLATAQALHKRTRISGCGGQETSGHCRSLRSGGSRRPLILKRRKTGRDR